MASISKISTQIVADARQFNSTVAGAGKLAESVFARMAKLEFIPGVKMPRVGPVKIGVEVDRGDSLQAVYDLLARVRDRAAKTGVALSTALNPRMPDTVRVRMIDNRNSVGPVMPLTTVSRVSFTKLPDQGPGPFAPRQQYASATPDSVKNRAFFPVDEGSGARFKARTLAVYKSVADGAKVFGLLAGHAMSHPNLGGAKALGDAWKNSFDRIIPSARNLYKMVSAPLTLTWRVLGVPDAAIARVRDRLRQSVQGTVRSAGGTFNSLVPSPRYAVIGALASVGISTYQFHEYAEKVSRAAIETKKFATSAGSGTYELQQMQYALRYVGQDAKGAVEALKTIEQLQTASKIGDYATTDLLARLGGSAGKAVRTGTDIDVVMEAVNRSITAQGAGIRSAALATHVYGDNAERVLRFALLTQSTQDRLEENMLRGGNVVDPKSLALLQQMDLMVNRIGLSFEGIVTKAVIAFGPIALSTLELLHQGLAGFNTDKMLADVKGFVTQVAVFVLNIPLYFTIISDYLVVAFGRAGEALDRLSARFYRVQADANRLLGDTPKADLLDRRANEMEAVVRPDAKFVDKPSYSQAADVSAANIKKVIAGLTTVNQLEAMIAARAKLALVQQMPYDLWDKMFGEARVNKPLIDGALQTAREVEQPFEKLKARLNALDLMRGIKDNMSDGTYGRAVLKAFTDTESGLQLTDIRLPGLARKDSTEAVSAINRSEVEYKMKIADTPAVRQQRILEQSYEVLLLIKEYAAKSADAAANRKTVSVGP